LPKRAVSRTRVRWFRGQCPGTWRSRGLRRAGDSRHNRECSVFVPDFGDFQISSRSDFDGLRGKFPDPEHQGTRPPITGNPTSPEQGPSGLFQDKPRGQACRARSMRRKVELRESAIVADAVAVNRLSPHRRGAPGDLAFCSALRPRPGSGDLFSLSSSRTLATVRTRVARPGGGPVSSAPGRLDRPGRRFHFQTRLMFLCLAGGRLPGRRQ